MITVTILTKGDSFTGYRSEGHAEYAESGEDIICAAASVLLINTANAIECLTKDRIVDEEEDGYLNVVFPDGLSHEGRLLMEAMLLGLQQIEAIEGSSSYLRIVRKEE